jgi:peroxiredoxin family protein
MEVKKQDSFSILLMSGTQDKVFSALTLATSAAAMGSSVSIFVSFWGLMALRSKKIYKNKGLMDRMLTMISPTFHALPLSNWNFFGIGRWLMARRMVQSNLMSLENLLEAAEDLGVIINICDITMDAMAITKEELVPYEHYQYCGAATLLADAGESEIHYYI